MLHGKLWLVAASNLLPTAGPSLTPQVRTLFPTGYLVQATFFGEEEVLFREMSCRLPSGSENWPRIALFTSVGVTRFQQDLFCQHCLLLEISLPSEVFVYCD